MIQEIIVFEKDASFVSGTAIGIKAHLHKAKSAGENSSGASANHKKAYIETDSKIAGQLNSRTLYLGLEVWGIFDIEYFEFGYFYI